MFRRLLFGSCAHDTRFLASHPLCTTAYHHRHKTSHSLHNLTPPPRDITETIDVKNQNVIGRLLCVYILYRYSPALKAYAFPRPPKKRGSGEKQTQQNVARMEGKSVIAQKLWTYFIGFICNWIIGLGNAAESSTIGEGGIYLQGGITRGNRIEENSK